MFKLVYGENLFDFPTLANQMFQDRRAQFRDEYGWDLSVDALGREIDRYDLLNPLYVILQDKSGRHLASGRLMPTTGSTMIADHFADMTDGVQIESPLIWEVTRVMVANRGRGSTRAAAALMWAGCEVGLRAGVEFLVGVTSGRMVRVFSSCGWAPEVIGRREEGTDREIAACLWEINPENARRLAARADIDPDAVDLGIYRRPVESRVPAFPVSITSETPPVAALQL